MNNNSDSDDRATSTSTGTSTNTSSYAYNAPSTLAPNQRDLRIQAAKRNAEQQHHHPPGLTANTNVNDLTGTATSDSDNDDQRLRDDKKSKRPDLARIITESANMHPSIHKESAQTASKNASDAVFAQLQVIQTLQVSISLL